MPTLRSSVLVPYRRLLAQQRIPDAQRSYYVRWLNLYLNSCERGMTSPRDPAQPEAFLAEIRQAHPSDFLINQARHAVSLFHQLSLVEIPIPHDQAGMPSRIQQPLTPTNDVPKLLAQIAGRVQGRMRQSVEDLIAVGADLLQAKALLPHGEFIAWIQREFDMSYVTANRLMLVAEAFGDKVLTVRTLSKKALYELAARGTTSRIRAQVISRLEAGERVSHAQILAMKQGCPPRPALSRQRSLQQSMRRLEGQLSRWTTRTRRQLESSPPTLDETARHELTRLQQRLGELDTLLRELLSQPA